MPDEKKNGLGFGVAAGLIGAAALITVATVGEMPDTPSVTDAGAVSIEDAGVSEYDPADPAAGGP